MRRAKRKSRPESELVRFGVSIPKSLIARFDDLLSARQYANRSEAVRDLIREHLAQADWTAGKGEQAATLVLVLDATKAEALARLQKARRDLGPQLASLLQLPLNPREELQVWVLRGNGAELRQHAEPLLGLKGVSLGKLILSGSTTAR